MGLWSGKGDGEGEVSRPSVPGRPGACDELPTTPSQYQLLNYPFSTSSLFPISKP